MLNLIDTPAVSSNFFHIGAKYFISLEKLFSKEVIEKINQFRAREIDHLIVRGLPTSDNLPDTPLKIRSAAHPALEAALLTAVARAIGRVSEKGIENTIRFNLEGEKTNRETWHSHFQYSSSVFYCLRGDPEARVYFLSANELMRNAGDMEELLTTPLEYIKSVPKFSLIEAESGKYKFSKYIFDRSELEKYIQDLDLPDAVKMLRKIVNTNSDRQAMRAASYFISRLENAQDHISYIPGDLMMVHDPNVIRYSPGYKTTIPIQKARWLLAVSLIG